MKQNEEPISDETILEPGLPIVDPHHHLWFIPPAQLPQLEQSASVFSRSLAAMLRTHSRYLFDEFLADLACGHNFRATVYSAAGAMYRPDGPEQLRSLGEVEFANGVAAMSASGLFGTTRVCAGIVGQADLLLGDAVEEVLRAHIQAGGTRYRGIRVGFPYDADTSLVSGGTPHLLSDARFRAGFKWLHELNLSADVLLFEPQLPDLIDLARSFPQTQIILNHVGIPLGVGRYAGKREQRFPIWRENMRTLAACSNVTVKLGGLGSTALQGFKSFMATPPATSQQLAQEWRPYIETCIEIYGANRCMFESDYPPGSSTCSYAVLWNAFKRIVSGASREEKLALFSGTAARVYRLDVELSRH